MSDLLAKKPSWKAVRRGNTFCAPACGGGCNQAKKDASVLAKRLGVAWFPRINENLGWFASAVNCTGRWHVHVNRYCGKISSYTAFLGDPGDAGGAFAATASSPEKAIAKVKREAKDRLINLLEQYFDLFPVDAGARGVAQQLRLIELRLGLN